MRYDERIVDQVQMANDIVEVIGQYVSLKRSGRNLKACCPFHGEKTPSFMVQPEKQTFHCFGCGVGGDVFTFLMRHENMSFPEALRQLAERGNIILPEVSSRKSDGPSESEVLHELYKQAADYYHKLFMDPVRGKEARDYFVKRGFDLTLAEELKIGWALDDWRALLTHLTKQGFKEEVLLKSALVTRSPKGQVYDTFRGRLLFPIANLQGKFVAFGGRLIKNVEGPKYLNSPENPVFHKRRELFGLHSAKKQIDRERPQILIVEGYFGWLRLYQHGFRTAAATLGTSLTDDHVHVLKRFAEEAVVIYDGDKAGEAASLRGLEVFLEGGMNVKVARLPAGMDPDDFILKEGPEAFRKLLSEARDFFDYKLEILTGRFNRFDSLGLMKITGEFLETFTKIQSPILTDRYLRKLAASLGVDENSLRSELLKLKKKNEKPAIPASEKTAAPAIRPAAAVKSPEKSDEEIVLLALAVEEGDLRRKLLSEFEETEFEDPRRRELFQLLSVLEAQKQPVNWPRILTRLEDVSFKEQLTALSSMEWDGTQKQQAFQDCLNHKKAKKVTKRLDDLRRSIAQAEREGNAVLTDQYMREYQTLWRESKQKTPLP